MDIRKLKNLPKRYTASTILVIAILLVMLLMMFKPSPKQAPDREQIWRVSSTQVIPTTVTPEITIYGKVETPQTSTMRAAIATDVVKVLVKEGDLVKKGQLLIQLDDQEVKLIEQRNAAEVKQLEAQLSVEKDTYANDQLNLKNEEKLLNLRKRLYDREIGLVKKKLLSEAKIDETEQLIQQQSILLNQRKLRLKTYAARITQLEADITQAKALLKQSQLDVEDAQIIAPYDGQIMDVSVADGMQVQPGLQLLRLYNRSALEVRAPIPNQYVDSLAEAIKLKPVPAEAMLSGHRVTFALTRLTGEIDTGLGSIDGFFQVKQAKGYLVPGRTVALQLQLPAVKNAVVIPSSALYNNSIIYKIQNQRLAAVNVTKHGTRLSKNGAKDWVVTSAQLQRGDVIMTTQLPEARSGLKVNAS